MNHKGREFTRDPSKLDLLTGDHRPYDQVEALVIAQPNHVVAESVHDVVDLREALNDAIDTWLDPLERIVFDARTIERLSYARIEEERYVTRTTAMRYYKRGTKRLRAVLSLHPIIKEHGIMAEVTDWEDAAFQAAGVVLRAYVEADNAIYAKVEPLEAYGHDLAVLRARVFEAVELDPEWDDDIDLGDISSVYLSLAIDAIAGAMAADTVVHVRSVVDLITLKQRDYGHQNIAQFGNHGLCIRMHDKHARLENLRAKGTEPSNESVADTWADMLGYALIGLMWEAGTFMLGFEE